MSGSRYRVLRVVAPSAALAVLIGACSAARETPTPTVPIPTETPVAAALRDGAVHVVTHAPGTCRLCDLYRTVQQQVVRIVAGNSLGAGVVVSRDGLVVTNAHVVGDETQVSVETESGAKYVGEVAARDPGEDLALVRIRSAGVRWTPVSIVAGDPPPSGSEVLIIGHPMGLGWTVTRGIVSARRVAPGVPSMIQTDAPISPGNSGGPMLDDEGHLLGIVTSKAQGGGAENLGFARPASSVVEFLRRAGVESDATPR